ncbi:phosphate acetyltransferase [Candidatus Neptunochlamydia vexilliferae]|uniref:phosphate acetyltransferase n=1 Tax=Candidatus Neptunichlamydia vexilliferae TaxID=1651774 RepID=UPI001891A0C8|nr:phosphate acetyltransferase [Candidatus Neptunochlamydia vexilliferae]
MKHTILMVPMGLGVGLTTVSIGLVHALERQGINVSYLNPFTHLDIDQVEHLLSSGKEETLLERIIEQVEKQSAEEGILVIQGIIGAQLRPYAPSLNNAITKALDAEVIFVTTPGGKSAEDLKEQLVITAKPYGGIESSRTIGCMINKVGAPVDKYGNARIDLFDLPEEKGEERPFCQTFNQPSFRVLGCFPWRRELMAPRVKDVAEYLNAEVISAGEMENRRVNFFAIAAATTKHVSTVLRPDVMIITPADRSDTILATCMAYLSGTRIAGLLLSGDYPVPKETIELCAQAMREGLPILSVKTDTLRTAISLQNLNVKIPEDDIERRTALKEFVASHINTDWLKELISTEFERKLSPPAFRYQLIEKARKARKKIVLPEGEELRIIQAAATCVEKKIAHPILLGNPEKIQTIASNNGVLLGEEIKLLDPAPLREKYLKPLLELRKHKGLTEQNAKEALLDPIVIGTMMLAQGEVDGLVAGTVHTTASTIRPTLKLIKTKPGVKKVSSIFFMCLPNQVLVYGDCAVNQNPTAEELADIAIQCADSAERFGIPPRVAMISYSTGTSGAGTDVTKVQEATAKVKELRPDLLIDGPLQYDAAFSPDVAAKKAPDSPVAGQATVYVFPDLNTANTTYKAVQRSADVLSIGPMLQGLKKPVNDLSRGALVDDIVYTIAITTIQAE